MDETVAELKSSNLLVEEEGRLVMFVPGEDVPLTIVKSDGGKNMFCFDANTARRSVLLGLYGLEVYVIDFLIH